ncbi:uncharacterized protein LOC136026883 isoform X2 [Artemia franciscana]|uniref:uncharacterized protein LOC136026883 isoform X2 n=1 Tax=Artemia franciscana TaxID=6661 RepID=UPI0032DB62CC
MFSVLFKLALTSLFLDITFCQHMQKLLRHRVITDFDEMEGDEEQIRNICCKRMMHNLIIGKGANGEDIEVDVGTCRKGCAKKASKIKKREFEALLKETDPKINPIELFLSLQKGDIFDSCFPGSTCNPSFTKIERYYTVDGSVDVPVIESCQCKRMLSECGVAEKLDLYFSGTPFERLINVGTCQADTLCSEDATCVPTKNATLAIEGPNGIQCVETIEECSCHPSCYRASKLENIYDYSNIDNDSEEAEPELMTIDIGVCVGTCNSTNYKVRKCILRDPENPKRCLSSLTHRSTMCYPTTFKTHYYMDKHGNTKSVLAIKHCSCK